MNLTRILPAMLIALAICVSEPVQAEPALALQQNSQADERWKNMTPAQRKKLRQAQQKYKNMTPEQRKKLREKYRRQQQKKKQPQNG